MVRNKVTSFTTSYCLLLASPPFVWTWDDKTDFSSKCYMYPRAKRAVCTSTIFCVHLRAGIAWIKWSSYRLFFAIIDSTNWSCLAEGWSIHVNLFGLHSSPPGTNELGAIFDLGYQGITSYILCNI